jgi:hypothetical protein
MKTSFRKTIEKETSAAPATTNASGSTDLATTAEPPATGLTGEWSGADIQIPRLSLVQKSGTLADEFPKGAFVYNREVVIGDGDSPFKLTVLTARKYYQEDIPFGESENLPRIFDRLEDARAAGFTLEWDSDLPRVKEAADLVVLIPIHAEHASFKFGGQSYARALWTLVSSAYNSAAKPIVTAAVCGHLREGLHKGGWDVTSTLRTNQRNSWYVPTLRARGLHEAGFVKFLEEEVL